MSTFFQQTAQTMIAKHIDRFPLLKVSLMPKWIHYWQKKACLIPKNLS